MKRTVKKTLADADVALFLTDNPDFFQRHSELLPDLDIPHQLDGATSLIERQVRVLRSQVQQLREQTEELVRNAHNNEELEVRVHKLTLELLHCQRLSQTFSTLYKMLIGIFNVDNASVRLIVPPRLKTNTRWKEFTAEPEKLRILYSRVFDYREPIYGALCDEQFRALFGNQKSPIPTGSCTVIPLNTDQTIGILGIASSDPMRFKPGMDNHYLFHLGEIVAGVLRRWVLL